MSVVHSLQLAFGVLGNAATLFLFLVPAITFKRIIKNKSTEQFSGVPYVMALLNCLLSSWYGLPFVTSNNILVATINGAGAAIELSYVIIFLVFASSKDKGKIITLLFIVLFSFAGAALLSILSFHGENRKLFCGTAAVIFSIVMYAAPMSIIRLVIKTKSVEYMPFFLSFSGVVSCAIWFTYAMLGKDPFIGTATGGGLALGIVQMIVYAIYCDKNVFRKRTTDESLELGNCHNCNGKSHHEEKKSSSRNHSNNERV